MTEKKTEMRTYSKETKEMGLMLIMAANPLVRFILREKGITDERLEECKQDKEVQAFLSEVVPVGGMTVT